MKTINNYAYNSILSNVTPNQKILFGVIPLFLCILLNSFFVSIFTILIMFYFSIKYSTITKIHYFKILLIPFSFLILSIIPIVFTITSLDNTIFKINFLNLTIGFSYTSLKYGALIFAKSLGAVSCMYFISLTTTMNDILHGLKSLKVPTIILSLMELIYRYIFILFDEAKKMKIAQQSRLGYKTFKISLISTGQLIAFLFIKTYLKCDNVYNALISRGYNGEIVTLNKEYKKNNKLNICLIANVILMILIALVEKRF